MDVIIMQSTASLVSRLKSDYPQFSFEQSQNFSWSPDSHTINYTDVGNYALLLHEMGHGLLEHASYLRDIELLTMERQAWDKALEIAKKYNLSISEQEIQSNLDTYRDWLHNRSTCPSCQATGLQINKHVYKCLACGNQWRVNEARICALRRYSL
jgi:hypothetical protein